MRAFLERPIEGDWASLWIDATYVKVRQNGRIISVAVIVAVGVNSDGRGEVLAWTSARPSHSQRARYMTLETILSDDPLISPSGCAHASGHDPSWRKCWNPLKPAGALRC